MANGSKTWFPLVWSKTFPADVEAFYRDMSAKGVLFSMPPKKQDFGGVLAQFVDSEGAHCSVGAEAA